VFAPGAALHISQPRFDELLRTTSLFIVAVIIIVAVLLLVANSCAVQQNFIAIEYIIELGI